MGGRYLITGVQIGTIRGSCITRMSADGYRIINQILKSIEESQFIGRSDNAVEADVGTLRNQLPEIIHEE